MSSSPYFAVTGRQTRSPTRSAIAALPTRQTASKKHVDIEYPGNGFEQKRMSNDDKNEDTESKKRKKDTSTKQAHSSKWDSNVSSVVGLVHCYQTSLLMTLLPDNKRKAFES